MSCRHAFENVLEIGKRLDVIELGGGDERADGSPALGTTIGSGKEVVFATERYHPFILPMSGRK